MFGFPLEETFINHFDTAIGLKILALDISKLSTGIAFFDGFELFSACSQTKLDFTNEFSIGRRMVEIEETILELTKGVNDFDVVVIENGILGQNADTTSVAYGLNFFIDYLIASGKIYTKRLVRVENTSWKKTLGELGGIKRERSGEEIEKSYILKNLQALGNDLACSVGEVSSWSKYLKTGTQDQLDAIGLALHLVRTFDFKNELNSVPHRRKKTIKVFGSMKEIEEELKGEKIPRLTKVSSKQLLPYYKNIDCFKEQTIVIKTDNISRLGIAIRDFQILDEYYILIQVR